VPFNVGTGRPTDFDTLAAMMSESVGRHPGFAHDLTKPVGPSWRVADPTLLRSFYEPRVTLEEGVARALIALCAA
jgi:nucleoside-diphosphate-sugar epimerase